MAEFSKNWAELPTGKLKFWKNIWMIFPGFVNKRSDKLKNRRFKLGF